MKYLLMLSTSISYYSILKNAGEAFATHQAKTRQTTWINVVLWTSHIFFFVLAQHYHIPSYLAFIILLLLMFLTFYAKFDESALPIYFASIHYVFYLYTIRAIVLSLAAILSSSTILELTAKPIVNLALFQLSLIFAIVYFRFLKKRFLNIDNVKILLRHPRQLSFILIHKTVLGIFMMFTTYNVYFTNNKLWFNFFHLMASILFTFLGTYTLKNGLMTSQTLDYQEHTELLEKQLSMQKLQYKSYQKFTESFRKFKHDFNAMMSNVNSLLQAGELKKAQKLLSQITHQMETEVQTHKKYSNNQLLDIVLQDFANQCQEKNIDFSSQLFWHEAVDIDDLSMLRIFNNILKNAFEANMLLNEHRFIRINSKLQDHWLSIRVENAYDGHIVKGFQSRKKNPSNHGIGSKIIREEVEKADGLINVDYDDSVFRLDIHFPLYKNKNSR